jgi:hypothetical protein
MAEILESWLYSICGCLSANSNTSRRLRRLAGQINPETFQLLVQFLRASCTHLLLEKKS